MPFKKKVSKVASSLRAPKGRGNLKKKIASSPASPDPRNDAKRTSLSVPVYSLAGRSTGTMTLPKEIFGQEVNQNLLAQAVRVYTTNQKRFTAKTKTRGEVKGSTAKVWRQKGTGRARHGSIRAPIFVGGGIVFGPRPRKVVLDLPRKMKKKALMYALSAKAKDKEVVGLLGAEKATGKTKQIAQLLTQLNSKFKMFSKLPSAGQNSKFVSALIVTAEKMDNVVRGARNIPGVSVLPTNQLNAYDILRHQILVVTKDSVAKLAGKGKK